MRSVLFGTLFAGLLALPALGQEAPESAQPSGRTSFWFLMWPDFLVKYDPETDQVVKKIQHRHGVCFGMRLSHDRKSFFDITGQRTFVEVIDVEKMEVVDEHSFEQQGFIIRVARVLEVPGGTHWYVRVDRVEKKLDHYVIQESQWLYYNLEDREVEKRMKELPKPIRRGARISPCGTKWHVFGRDLTIVDPETLEEEGKIELSKPLYSGMGALSVRGRDLFDGKNAGAYRMLYTMRDPVKKNRTLMGILDLDLDEREVTNRREWGASPGVGRFLFTRDRKVAVGQKRSRERRRQYDGQDPVVNLYSMDLETGRKIKETRVEVRNGLGLTAISPDGQKLYFSGRGHELVIYSADHTYLKTVELEGEIERGLVVLEE